MLTTSLFALVLAAEPHPSYDKLVTGNGFAGAVVNGSTTGLAVVDRFSDHLWQQEAEGREPVRDLLYDAYFGVRVDGGSGWMTRADSLEMEPGTNIIRVERSNGDLRMTESVFAPMTLEWPALVQVFEVVNTGAEPVELSAFGLANFHVGDQSNESERIAPAAHGGLVEVGDNTSLVMHLVPLVPPSTLGCSPANVWSTVRDGGVLSGCAESAGDDQVGALQWDLGVLQPGESVTVGFMQVFNSGGELALPAVVSAALAGATPASLLEAEREDWARWQARTTLPPGLSEDEALVASQALAWLRMAQVREPGSAYGQIPASLLASSDDEFSHVWNITWVRDAAFSIAALSAYGHPEESRAALEFFLQDRAGDYSSYLDNQDYAVSVCRVYGNGDEWSDEDQDGPNIELDNFGLLLWAAGRYLEDSGDVDFAEAQRQRLLDGTAAVLAGLVDPETGLIRADSSIWEEHWNGKQRRFAWTSAWAVAGLRAADALARAVGEQPRYGEVADGVAAAIESQLVDGVLWASYEDLIRQQGGLDAAAVAVFNLGILDPASSVGVATLAAWDEELGVYAGPGYRRNDDGDDYDNQEWIVVDLWIAEALQRAGRDAKAAALDAWVTDMAVQNHLILPELLNPGTADFRGPAPMLGFGAAAYLLRVHDRALISGQIGGDDTADSGPDTPTKDAGARCGCANSGGAGLLVGLAGLALALGRRAPVQLRGGEVGIHLHFRGGAGPRRLDAAWDHLKVPLYSSESPTRIISTVTS